MKDSHLESKKRLEHILKAIDYTQKFIQNESLENFCKNAVLHNAVLYNFTIMGEAIVHVEMEKLTNYTYPWYKVRSFRNMIAHELFQHKITGRMGNYRKRFATVEGGNKNSLKTRILEIQEATFLVRLKINHVGTFRKRRKIERQKTLRTSFR